MENQTNLFDFKLEVKVGEFLKSRALVLLIRRLLAGVFL